MGITVKNKTMRKGDLKDTSVFVIADGYSGTNNYNGVDAEGNVFITSHEGKPQHFNGTATTVPTDITPAKTTTQILIHHMGSGNKTLDVSFDGGSNYFSMAPEGVLQIDTEITIFKVKSSSSTVDYQIIVTGI